MASNDIFRQLGLWPENWDFGNYAQGWTALDQPFHVYLFNSMIVVVFSIVEGRNRFVQLRTVDMPGGSTAFRLGGNDRFDLVFDLPTVLHSKDAWVSANAYDLTGNIIARARTALAGGAVGAARAGS